MSPSEPRGGDRTVHYTMKTSVAPSTPSHGPGHSSTYANANAQPLRTTCKSNTPTASSPHFPFSVGQPYPPKLSPPAGASNRLTTPVASGAMANHARTPSPNYFGLVVEPTPDLRESAMLPTENWSPPTSSVKSFAAAIPKQVPLDANPEFEAFRRQADANRGRSGFMLATSSFGVRELSGSPFPQASGASPAPARPRPSRWHTYASDVSTDQPAIPRSSGPFQLHLPGQQTPQPEQSQAKTPMPLGGPPTGLLGGRESSATSGRMDVDVENNSVHDSAYVSADSKRNSEASLNPPSFFNMPRHESPAQFESPFEKRTMLSTVEDRHPRLSVMQGKLNPPTPDAKNNQPRADTLPAKTEPAGPAMISASELKDLLLASSESDLLLLDLRVSTLYATSRIQGALNLCIPTTLLKRATFNLEKLEQTFQSDADQQTFANWRATKNLVVYDAFSAEKRDATSCMNMLKKFTNEGYEGRPCILRGGFNGFSQAWPQLVDHLPGRQRPGVSSLALNPGAGGGDHRPAVAPVIGGVMLPQDQDAQPTPFFGNIRQNMDLADGVGQMDVAVPPGVDNAALPAWLSEVAQATDHGKRVSDKFLGIERKEQARMRRAYTAFRASASTGPGTGSGPVQISGIEKGVKNRYSNILPFEHARVRLGGKHEGDCDYINASHISSTRSHKRYIATQGPLPDTYEDFWSMIWDQDVRVIVMLTAEREGGHMKCHPYWRGKEFGPLRLRALSEKKVSLDIDRYRTNSGSTMPGHSRTQSVIDPTKSSTPGPQSTSGHSQFAAAAEMGRRRANTTNTVDGFNFGPNPGSRQSSMSGASGSGATPQTHSPPHGGEAHFVIIRKFAMSHASQPFAPIREVTHLHYPSWPDFGAPAQPSHLLALVELANVMQRAALPGDVPLTIATASSTSPSFEKRASLTGSPPLGTAPPLTPAFNDEPVAEGRSRPMLVHCSAGCGRTGTFCTVDSVLDMLKRQRQRAAKRANAAAGRKLREGVKRKLGQRDSDGDVAMTLSSTDLSSSPVSASTPALTEPDRHRRRRNDDSNSGGVSPSSSGGGTGYDSAGSGTRLSRSGSSDSSTTGGGGDAGLDTAWLDDEAVDLIANTVEDFRGQRLSMVQTIRQFVLCYETVLEWVARVQDLDRADLPPPTATPAPGPSGSGTQTTRP